MLDLYHPDIAITDLRGSIVPLLSRARTVLLRRVDQALLEDNELRALEVTAAQFAVLANVLDGHATTACALCAHLDYDRGAMSRMIDRLESRGLIRRARYAHNRRTIALEVTPEGKAAFPKMKACVARALNRSLSGLTASQVQAAERVLKTILANG